MILYVPEGSIDAYKETTPWSNFEEIIALAPPITHIELSQTYAILAEKESCLITAKTTPNKDDIPLVWSSDAPDIATVDTEGKVTAINTGIAKITVTANDGSGLSATCEVEVQKHYVLKYIIDDEVYYTCSIAAGTKITLPEEPAKKGYTFSGWSGVPETMPASDVTINGTFIVNKYLVTFKVDDEVIAADSLEYGAAIVAPEAPEKEGHTFNGWGEVAETVPANDVTYEGSYTVNTYKVYYYVGEELVHTEEVAYGEAIPEYIYEPEEGYSFIGWVGESYETMPAHDVTYTANIESGIDSPIASGQQQTVIYDLTGRKVTDIQNLKGGIYIINGKKVVIK